MRITRKQHRHKAKATMEVIDFHPAEMPFVIKLLYHVYNKPDKCKICGKPSDFVRVEVMDFTNLMAYKICKTCLLAGKHPVTKTPIQHKKIRQIQN